MSLNKPIILLGFHRSGTTLLGRIFSQHPQVAYWSEPRHVWMRDFIYRKHDVLTAADATPRVAGAIERQFEQFLKDEGGIRFAEKTPSNMVRLPFIRRAFPDARVIHIIRDGRASTLSTLDVLERPARNGVVTKRARSTPLWHYPAYIPKAWRNVIRPRLPGGSIPYWGPRIPGLRRRARTLSKAELCAWQWQQTLNIALEDACGWPSDQYREWRYEALVTNPVEVVRQMFEFAELDLSNDIESWLVETIHTDSLEKWKRGLSEEQIARIVPHLEPLLSQLGYGDPRHATSGVFTSGNPTARPRVRGVSCSLKHSDSHPRT